MSLPVSNIAVLSPSEIVSHHQALFREGTTRPVAFRIDQLRKLRAAIIRYEPRLLAALRQDLNKSEREAYATEIGIALTEIRVALRGVKRWAKPKRAKTPMTHSGASSRIVPEPYGTTLIISPWNYPFQLSIVPIVSAIAAGNTVVLKPSELTPTVSALLAELIGETFPSDYITVVEGDAQTSTELLRQPFDHIFFTGSPAVGKLVMEAAAKHLAPVTLELGGKSPCIVHKDADIALAAKRIAFGKFTNAGQTCVAPDYVLVHREVKAAFIAKMNEAIKRFYGDDPFASAEYGRIVNERHFKRLTGYLSDGKIVSGGQLDERGLKIAPTLLDQVPLDSSIMREEIFGPLLPLLEYETEEEIEAVIEANPKPLALYVFTKSSDFSKRIIERIRFGDGCINDTIMHFGSPYLPIGGVGGSGIGSYHGEYGFRTFSHYKSILNMTNLFDPPFRYPGSKWGMTVIRKLLR
ncbi:aldehyde dehydrogenase [Cohnella yongneupensis]|uniref:Aldehyde dehydrogenase n=1 Tax=Cohnella yongneupensis TaxID=425006 RepID=A0ABW0R506_9BACL